MTRKREYSCEKLKKKNFILNQTSNKTKETNFAGIIRGRNLFHLQAQSIADSNLCALHMYISALILYCMGISVSVRPVDQQRRQLAVRFYSKWYFARSGIDVLARRFRLALNRYIILESADERNDFFEHVIL